MPTFYYYLFGFGLLCFITIVSAKSDDLPMATGMGLVTVAFAIMSHHHDEV